MKKMTIRKMLERIVVATNKNIEQVNGDPDKGDTWL